MSGTWVHGPAVGARGSVATAGACLAGLLLAGAAPTLAGPSENVIFHARLDEHPGYNDIWGYTAPGGDEYALLGTVIGLAVIDVTDPDNPFETGFFPGNTSTWRDIKTYDHYAYVVNESGGGLQIVNLADPAHPSLVGFYTGNGFATAHNLFIDTATARAYLLGFQSGTGGFILLDLTDPEAPVEITRWTGTYFHDAMVQDGVLYGAAINAGKLIVLDVSDPFAITELGTAEGYPNAYTHNAWVTPDNVYVMTTDETAASSCRMWDLSTLPSLVQTDEYRPAPNVIPHNTHIEGGLAFISYYTLGVKILDVSDPHQLVEVGSYDTWPDNDSSNYDGCWGVFPFFGTHPNLIVASDIANGLYVLEYKGLLGALAGTVTETGAPGTPVADVDVEILQSGLTARGDGAGQYTIQDLAGPVDARFRAFGYETNTVPATIVTGVTTPLDVTLDPLPRGSVAGTVVANGSGTPIAGATVEVVGTPLAGTTDGTGSYGFDAFPTGTYTIRTFAFGYTPMKAEVAVADGSALTADFALNAAAYANDFESGTSGWSVVTIASRGDWELADPQGTYSGGTPVQPEDDATPAPGTVCWVTDSRAGASASTWDVDDGTTILTSPIIPTWEMSDPHVRYSRWYSTGVGNPDIDAFVVELSTNGGGSWPIKLEDTEVTTNAWIEVDISLNAFAVPSSLTRFRFTAQDTGVGGVVEAALDRFMVYDGVEQAAGTHVTLPTPALRDLYVSPGWPNPCTSDQEFRLEFALPGAGPVAVGVYDVRGRRVASLVEGRLEAGPHAVRWDGRDRRGGPVPAGVYFVRVQADGDLRTRKLVRLR